MMKEEQLKEKIGLPPVFHSRLSGSRFRQHPLPKLDHQACPPFSHFVGHTGSEGIELIHHGVDGFLESKRSRPSRVSAWRSRPVSASESPPAAIGSTEVRKVMAVLSEVGG